MSSSSSRQEQVDHTCKVVIVGDGAIGKTCMLDTLLGKNSIDWSDPDYLPSCAANLNGQFRYDPPKRPAEQWGIEFWDTAGQEALKSLRSVAYPDTDVFLIGFDMTRSSSLENIWRKDDDKCWKAEIDVQCTDYTGLVLVGCKHDLWEKKKDAGSKTMPTHERVLEVASQIGASALVYTSAKTGYGINCDDILSDADEPQILMGKILQVVHLHAHGDPVPTLSKLRGSNSTTVPGSPTSPAVMDDDFVISPDQQQVAPASLQNRVRNSMKRDVAAEPYYSKEPQQDEYLAAKEPPRSPASRSSVTTYQPKEPGDETFNYPVAETSSKEDGGCGCNCAVM